MKDFEIIRFNFAKTKTETKEIIVLYDLIISSYSSKLTKAKFVCELSLNIIIFKYDCSHAGNNKIVYVFEL